MSYDGVLATGVAGTGVPGLETVVPIAPGTSLYEMLRANGTLSWFRDGLAQISAAIDKNPPEKCAAVRRLLTEGVDDDTGNYNAFWHERNYRTGPVADVSRIRASVFAVMGSNDLNVKPSQLSLWWDGLAQHGVARKLWLTQYGHVDPFDFRRTAWVRTLHQWFDHELWGIPNDVLRQPRVDVQLGPDRWITQPDWPVPTGRALTLWPGSDGSLGIRPSSGTGTYTDALLPEAELIADPDTTKPTRLAYLTPAIRARVAVSRREVGRTVGQVRSLSGHPVDHGRLDAVGAGEHALALQDVPPGLVELDLVDVVVDPGFDSVGCPVAGDPTDEITLDGVLQPPTEHLVVDAGGHLKLRGHAEILDRRDDVRRHVVRVERANPVMAVDHVWVDATPHGVLELAEPLEFDPCRARAFAGSTTVIMKIDLAGSERRGLAMGLNEAAGYGALAVTSMLTGWLAAQYGWRPVPFLLGAAYVAIALGLSTMVVRETRAHAQHEAAGYPGNADDLCTAAVFRRVSLTDPTLSSVSQAGLVNNLNDGLAWGLLPILFTAHGLTLAQVGAIAAIYPAVWGLGQLVTGHLSDHLGRKRLIVAGMLTQAAGLALFAAMTGYPAWVTAAVLLGAGTAMVYPTLLAAIGDVTHPRWRARAVGVYRLWRDAGFAVGALVAGLLADAFGMTTAIACVAALTAASGVVVLVRMSETHARQGG